ncbi:MAG: pinensin family lanthipeptide [Cyclobacteriaceae bacterium]
MKKNIKLEDLKVKSFSTSGDDQKNVKGGASQSCVWVMQCSCDCNAN